MSETGRRTRGRPPYEYESKTISLRLPSEVYLKVKSWASENHATISSVTTSLLNEFVSSKFEMSFDSADRVGSYKPGSDTELKTYSIRVPERQYKEARLWAVRSGVPIGAVITDLLRGFVANEFVMPDDDGKAPTKGESKLPSKNGQKNISPRLPVETCTAVKAWALENNATISSVVVSLLSEFVASKFKMSFDSVDRIGSYKPGSDTELKTYSIRVPERQYKEARLWAVSSGVPIGAVITDLLRGFVANEFVMPDGKKKSE